MGSGPLVTLLHGFPSSSYDWATLAPELARDHSVLALDFLVTGSSPE